MKKVISLVLALVMALSLVACGSSSSSSASNENKTEAPADVKMKICIVTSSGVDDDGFNANCYKGALDFVAEHPDCTITDVKESDLNQLVPTVEKLAGDYDAFILPGFNFADCGDVCAANPDTYFMVVDSALNYSEGVTPADNVYTMTFKEYESGFFVGVAAAMESQTGKVAEILGIAYPSNVNYQYGFACGIKYANAHYGTNVELVEIPSYAGVDIFGTNVGGNYVGSFDDQDTCKQIANTLIDEGCDIIFVSCGSSGSGAMTAIKEADGVKAIGVDVDIFNDGQVGDHNIVLTSSLKIMDLNVYRQLTEIYNGTFKAEDALLGADTDSTGIVTAEGRHQMSDATLKAVNEAIALVKEGKITIPADATVNDLTPADFNA